MKEHRFGVSPAAAAHVDVKNTFRVRVDGCVEAFCFTIDLNLSPRQIAHGKIENMVTAAREVVTELDAGELDPDDIYHSEPKPVAD